MKTYTYINCVLQCVLAVLLVFTRGVDGAVDMHNYRLVDGKSWYGKVEIENQGEYHALCVKRLDDDMAEVLCKRLAFQSGVPYKMAKPLEPLHDTNYVSCLRSAQNISECFRILSYLVNKGITDNGECGIGKQQAAVMCFGKVRLSYPHNTNSGKVQVYGEDGRYHDLCRVGFNDNAAEVVCKQLGFKLGKAICCPKYVDGFGAPSNTNTTYCSGSENDITECIGSQLCPYSTADSTVVCSYGDPISDTNTLAFDQNPDGSLVVLKGSHPGYICADGFDEKSAGVFCHSRGYKFGEARRFYPHIDSSFWVFSVRCEGNENSLLYCPVKIITDETCDQATAVYCYDHISTQVSLVGDDNGERSGLVQIQKHGKSGIFCKADDDSRGEAKTVCRQINSSYVDGDVYELSPMPLPEFEYRWKIKVDCSGDVSLLDACIWEQVAVESISTRPIKSIGDYCDDSSNPLSIYCYGKVRLGCGYGSHSGVINMHVDGEWKYVCMHSNFTDVEATVACKSLDRGFNRGRVLPGNLFASSFLVLNSPVQNLKCDETHTSLFDCRSTVAGDSCGDNGVAGLYCYKGEDTPKEDLTVEYSPNGRVLVYKNGIKSGIDYRQWTDNEATVVCREQGFQNGLAVTLERRSLYRNGACYPTLVQMISCTGSESSLANCSFIPVQQSTFLSPSYSSQIFDAGVNCFNKVFTGDTVRLTGGTKPNYGRFEVKIDGEWGAVCNRKRTLTTVDAENICRAVNYTAGFPYSGESLSRTNTGKSWNIYLNCDNPYSPGRCFSGHWEQGNISAGENICGKEREVAVYCYSGVRLSTGPGSSSGAVMIPSESVLEGSYICGDGFGDQEALVTCKQLGFNQGRAIESKDVIWHVNRKMEYFNASCSGDESSILECVKDFAPGVCSSNKSLASVQCYDNEMNNPGTLDALMYLPLEHKEEKDALLYHSTVLVYSGGFWGYVNGKTWNIEAAGVLCRQLGYADVRLYGYTNVDRFTTSDYPLVINTITCEGTEEHLQQCNYTTPKAAEDTWDDRVATALCENPIPTTETPPNSETTELICKDTSGTDKIQVYGNILALMTLGHIICWRLWREI